MIQLGAIGNSKQSTWNPVDTAFTGVPVRDTHLESCSVGIPCFAVSVEWATNYWLEEGVSDQAKSH